MNSLQKRLRNTRVLYLLGVCLLLAGLLVGCANSQPAAEPTPVAQDNPQVSTMEKPRAVSTQVVSSDQPAIGPRTAGKASTESARQSKAAERPTRLKRPDSAGSKDQLERAQAVPVNKPSAGNPATSASAAQTAPPSHDHAAGKGCGAEEPATAQVPPKPSKTPPMPGHPHFACKEMTVTGEPVWQGQKARFNFVVTNEGTADLQLRVKGG